MHHLRKLNIAYDVYANLPYRFNMMNALKKYLVSAELSKDDVDFVDEFEDDVLGEAW